jgi:rhodanese-related sulfurtransferase
MFKPAHELVIEAKKSVKESSAEDIQKKIDNPQNIIIDVREPEEFQQGHIPSAINIPRGLLEFKISSDATLQNLEHPIIVYCKTSGRAALSAVALQAMGFKNVVSLAGGFDAWSAEGRKILKPSVEAIE